MGEDKDHDTRVRRNEEEIIRRTVGDKQRKMAHEERRCGRSRCDKNVDAIRSH